MIGTAEIAALRDRHSLAEIARAAGAKLRRSGAALVGSCPICSTKASGSATRFEIKADGRKWLCAVCADGGDVIRLVQAIRGLDFRGAVAWLGGAPALDDQTVARRRAEREAQEERARARDAAYRDQERARLYRLWRGTAPIAGSLVETYLAARGLALPATRYLRFLAEAPYYHGQTDDGRVRRVHVGPAMLAAIIRFDPARVVTEEMRRTWDDEDGDNPPPDLNPLGIVFSGLHFTYLAADGTGKATIVDPESGEILPAKKVRGSKSGGAIPLVTPAEPRRLFWGEGIETVLSVAQDPLVARAADAYWAAVDLSNIGGKALSSVAHPTELGVTGRPRRVPGPDPDLTTPAAMIPASVDELVILGDGDSDPFLTRQAALRCAKRYDRPGRVVRAAWANAGADFNDMARGRA